MNIHFYKTPPRQPPESFPAEPDNRPHSFEPVDTDWFPPGDLDDLIFFDDWDSRRCSER